ncbi:MAG: NADH:flavin oxidoreductase [Candidatus Brevundimonas phytovorans]|nr:NADH:flavin oxidoreductase [Brevundimonas sp.]WEK56781.1 MAG: NADH:flavin oxidoreductase [Brevundimonas sp.]
MRKSFTPVRIGPATLTNRYIRSGANEMMTWEQAPSQALLAFHERLAAGGVGMTTLAYVAVSPDGRTFAEQGVMSEASLPQYRAVVDAVHAHGALASAQITHGGSFVQHKELSTRRARSADGGLDMVGMMVGRLFQHQMTRADMDEVIAEFVLAAERCRTAGFDAVEIHMGHGYLLNQFISPLSNHRKDEYGGSAEARVRFPAEVLKAVKAAVGSDLAVLAKINLYDGVKGGGTVEDAIVTARALEAAGADMLVLSGGRNVESAWAIFNSPLPYADLKTLHRGLKNVLQFALLKAMTPKSAVFRELYFLEAARRVRAAVACGIGYVGGMLSAEAAEQLLDEGFDAVVMARALVHEPALVNRFKDDPAARSHCISCNRCVATMYTPEGLFCPISGNDFPQAMNQTPAVAR